jgi:uncharacterized membrane-anchored protein YhcB (DUF1043 family)
VTVTLLITAVLAFAFGMVVGGLLFNRMSPDQNKNRELEKHLHDKQEEIKSYQQEVKQHFNETSHLLKQLAENYREVHNHLAQGAADLCEKDPTQPIIKKLPEMQAIEINEPIESIQAPLDYAPKSTPFDKSALSEDYDLEKVSVHDTATAEEIAEAIAQQASPNKENKA